jgi:hypothetical protein
MPSFKIGLFVFLGAMLASLYALYSALDRQDVRPPPVEDKVIERLPVKAEEPCVIYQYWAEEDGQYHYAKQCSRSHI